jgi:uncharacterized protein YdeI (BOF family)
VKLKSAVGLAAAFAVGALGMWGGLGIASALSSQPLITATSSSTEPGPSKPSALATDKEITSIAELQRNTIVYVAGEVTRIADEDEFVLTDRSGEIKVFTGNTFFAVELGEILVVRGFVDDGPFQELYAQEILHEDGSSTVVNNSY